MYRPAYELTCKSDGIGWQIGLRRGASTVEGFRMGADVAGADQVCPLSLLCKLFLVMLTAYIKFDIQWDFTHMSVNVCTIAINGLYVLDQEGVVSCASSPAESASSHWVIGSTSIEGEYTYVGTHFHSPHLKGALITLRQQHFYDGRCTFVLDMPRK